MITIDFKHYRALEAEDRRIHNLIPDKLVDGYALIETNNNFITDTFLEFNFTTVEAVSSFAELW